MTDQYCLKWNNYQTSVTRAFKSLREKDDFVDVTLSADGKNLKAHKVVLSACSPYFRDVLKDIGQWQHAVLVLRDVSIIDLQYILEFVYVGQVNVVQENLQSFLKTAELLRIRGLTDDMGNAKDGNLNCPDIGDVGQGLDQESRKSASLQVNPFLSLSSSLTSLASSTMASYSNRGTQDKDSSNKKRKKSNSKDSKDDAQNVPENEPTDMKREPFDDQEHMVEKGAVASNNTDDLDGGGSPVDPSQFVKMDMDELESEDAAKGLVVRHDLLSMFGERGRCHFCGLLCSDRDALTVHLKTAHQPAKHALCENCENFFHVCAIQRHRMKCHIRYVSDK